MCKACLHSIKVENGKRRAAGQTPAKGSVRERQFRDGPVYRQVYMPEHPDTTKSGWMMEHRFVMERLLGRRLSRIEVVHHRDRNGLNNDPENLELEADRGSHLAVEHCMEGVSARMAAYPRCSCGARTAFGETVCWKCWSKSQTCPTCGRQNRKMARRDVCHGCYKALRVREGRAHRAPKAKSDG